MSRKTIIILVLSAIAAALVFGFYKRKAGGEVKVDPGFHHTAEGVNFKIQEQQVLLSDAVKRRDLEFVHNQMYYVQTLADALSSKLTGEKKQQVDAILHELKRAAEEIDNWAGRGNQPATEASFQKLSGIIGQLNAHFSPKLPAKSQ